MTKTSQYQEMIETAYMYFMFPGKNSILQRLRLTVIQCMDDPYPGVTIPDSKVHGANMGPIWGRQDPRGPHVGPMNFVIWDTF